MIHIHLLVTASCQHKPPSTARMSIVMEVCSLNKSALLPGQLWLWAWLLLFRVDGAHEPFQSTLRLLLCRCGLFGEVSSSRDCGLDHGLAARPTRNAIKVERPTSGHTVCHPTGQVGSTMCGDLWKRNLCRQECSHVPGENWATVCLSCHMATTVCRKVEARAPWLVLWPGQLEALTKQSPSQVVLSLTFYLTDSFM